MSAILIKYMKSDCQRLLFELISNRTKALLKITFASILTAAKYISVQKRTPFVHV